MGVWAIGTPEEFGGPGGSVLDRLVVVEQLSRSLLGFELIGRMGDPLPILLGGTPDQQERFVLPVVRGEAVGAFALTEPTGGTDPAGNMTTTASREGDGWVLNGRKTFVSLGREAAYTVVFARTGMPRSADGITAFIVEAGTPGFSLVRTIPTMGVHNPAEIDLHNCLVPDANRLGEVGAGFRLAQEQLGVARLDIGARAVGACERLVELAIDHVGSRQSFGSAIASHQGVRWMLADCVIDLDTVRALTYVAALTTNDLSATRMRESIVKVAASEALDRVADRVLQLFGGWGYAAESLVQQFYREARMWRIVEGPNEIHRDLIGRLAVDNGVLGLRL